MVFRRASSNVFKNPINLVADGKGGAYITVGGAYYLSPAGVVSTVADQNIRSNGIMLSPDGRTLYVTANKGIHVLSPQGQHLGLILTPRRPITLAFSGPDQKTLYVPLIGAVGPDGKAWTTPDGVRNTAMTIYKIPMLAEGFKGRPK